MCDDIAYDGIKVLAIKWGQKLFQIAFLTARFISRGSRSYLVVTSKVELKKSFVTNGFKSSNCKKLPILGVT